MWCVNWLLFNILGCDTFSQNTVCMCWLNRSVHKVCGWRDSAKRGGYSESYNYGFRVVYARFYIHIHYRRQFWHASFSEVLARSGGPVKSSLEEGHGSKHGWNSTRTRREPMVSAPGGCNHIHVWGI